MMITSGTIDLRVVTTGPYNYYDLQMHHWDIGATSAPISNSQQEVPCTWSVAGHGGKDGWAPWQYSGGIAGGNPVLNVVINSAGLVYLARTGGSILYSFGYTMLEPGFPSKLQTFSPNLTNSFSFSEVGTAFLTILSGPNVPVIRGKSFPIVLGPTNFYLPSSGESYSGQRYAEPGNGHSTAWWRWTINF